MNTLSEYYSSKGQVLPTVAARAAAAANNTPFVLKQAVIETIK